MMGSKDRPFASFGNTSVEDLIPANHFYRCLQRALDLSFVRDLVRERYANSGRSSIDPVVCFKTRPTHDPY